MCTPAVFTFNPAPTEKNATDKHQKTYPPAKGNPGIFLRQLRGRLTLRRQYLQPEGQAQKSRLVRLKGLTAGQALQEQGKQ